VATVPQDTTVSFEFTVRQVVEMGRHPHRGRFGPDPDPGAVDRALARTATGDLADRPVGRVSGGERQRAVLARTLAQDAPVLVLDEPTASLDVNHQVETLDLVRGLVGEGRTAVAAIHDLNLAARYCDRLALLADGRLLASGEPQTVLTEELLAEAFDADAVVTDHPVTGSPLVTALGGRPETRRTAGEAPLYPES
jgi:iron complex transport system ATP-binding protein